MTPSQQTLDALYRQYHRQIHGYLSRMTGDAQEAEDLTQEVFLKAYRQLANRPGPGNTRSWLFRVATCTCFDHFRRRSRRVRAELIPDDAQLASAVDPFEQSESAAAVVASLHRLAARHRAALILKDVHGFNHAEIARALGISEGASQILLHRARDKFRHAYVEALAGSTVECRFAARVALDLVGTTLTATQRRDLRRHAETCPRCRSRLAGRAVPVGALGFLLRPLPAPGSAAPILPPPVPPPLPPPVLDIGGLHGALSQVTSALASKAAVVALGAALAASGPLMVQSVTSPGARGDGSTADVSRSLPTPAADAAPEGGGGARIADAGTAHGAGAVRGQPTAEDWLTWRAHEGAQLRAPSTERATGGGEASPERARTAGAADRQSGTDESGADNLGPGTTQETGGSGYGGTTVSPAGGQPAGAGRGSAPAGTETAGGDGGGDPGGTPPAGAGDSLGGGPGDVIGGEPGKAALGDPGGALGGDPGNTPGGDLDTALGGPDSTVGSDPSDGRPPRTEAGG